MFDVSDKYQKVFIQTSLSLYEYCAIVNALTNLVLCKRVSQRTIRIWMFDRRYEVHVNLTRLTLISEVPVSARLCIEPSPKPGTFVPGLFLFKARYFSAFICLNKPSCTEDATKTPCLL